MKIIQKVYIVLFIALITVSMVSASSEQLPAQKEVTEFLDGCINMSASDIMNDIKEDHPVWKADLLKCSTCTGNQEAIALYCEDSASTKGYGSIYFKDGKIVSPSSLSGYTVKESYKGELEESDNSTNESLNTSEEPDVEVIQDNSTTSERTYEAFSDLVDKYDGNCVYSSDNITSLCSYFTNLGWDAEVQYCVAVNTSDEGMRYIVLGV